MNIIDIINHKRLGNVLSKDEIDFFIHGVMDSSIADYQISSLLMAICLNGMNDEEIFNLTDAMIKSGDTIDLSNINAITIDKHSTGGVGDKVTLVLAPLLASLGFCVAKMSGRGLGHTGGTIDKLEAISGYNVELSEEDFLKQVNDINIAIISQTGNLAPADKKLYALRDVTGTVESIPLIAASIMSKKIASGSKYIILDVKVGNGALMKNVDDAKKLAETMIEMGKKYERKVICLLTNMDEPLGYAIGNGLEVQEALNSLNLKGPKDLNTVVLNMAAVALKSFKNISFEEAVLQAKENLINKSALDKFNQLVKAQGGNIDNITISDKKLEIRSCEAGYIKSINALKLGEAAKLLGAGRTKKEDIIDYGVGIVLNKKVGDYIANDEVLLTIYYNDETNLEYVKNNISNYFELTKDKVEPVKLILDIIY